MPSVTREIHIDAQPDRVREHVADPQRRRHWLDEEAPAPSPTDDGGLVYVRRTGDDTAHVHIEVLPDGDGTLVRVTEDLAEPERGDDEPSAHAELVAVGHPGHGAPSRCHPLTPAGDRDADDPTPRLLAHAA